jgi:hypothetical protein
MNASTLMTQLLIGVLLGAFGQAIRTVVGLKKLSDRAGDDFAKQFSPAAVAVSLLLGALAGVAGIISLPFDAATVGHEQVLFLIGTGYAGADFIEGFMKRHSLAGEGSPHGAIRGGGPAAGR